MASVSQSPAWRALQENAQRTERSRIVEWFAADASRAERFSCTALGLHLDYSKQNISPECLQLLLKFSEQQQLSGWIARLFAGEPVNQTEGRAALHMALRAPKGRVMAINGHDVVPDVHAVLDRMCAFADRLRANPQITDVVNIGIGGSDLGPRMVCESLQDHCDGPRVHFVANVDATQLSSLLRRLEARRTLFIITSKTFTTQETMANAQAARAWFLKTARADEIPAHFAAVSTNLVEVQKFGIHPDNVFGFWDWVGGRYSVWSAVGLSALIALGESRFRALLAGAQAMDEHFRTAPHHQNLPVLMALLNVWNTNFLGAASQVIAPYAQRLEKFVSWLQQLEMESNGKSVARSGAAADYLTTPALWGDVGTNSQHAFFQMLHQGPQIHPVDFILPLKVSHGQTEQHRMLVANCLAQSAALMQGKSADAVCAELTAKGMSGAALEAAIPHRVFSGNRPSNTLLLPELDAWNLGLLMALYEHRTFVQSVLWEINPFDQWGVELGKQLAVNVLKAMDGEPVALDGSTAALLERAKAAL